MKLRPPLSAKFFRWPRFFSRFWQQVLSDVWHKNLRDFLCKSLKARSSLSTIKHHEILKWASRKTRNFFYFLIPKRYIALSVSSMGKYSLTRYSKSPHRRPKILRTSSLKFPSLTRLTLSASCGCLNWVYRHLFWCVHPPTARYTWFPKQLPVSQCQCQVYWAPSVFYFSDNSLVFMLFFMFLYCIPISNEKLNGHQTFESLGLIGAFTFLFKQHIS